jgi:hypothetical protein
MERKNVPETIRVAAVESSMHTNSIRDIISSVNFRRGVIPVTTPATVNKPIIPAINMSKPSKGLSNDPPFENFTISKTSNINIPDVIIIEEA